MLLCLVAGNQPSFALSDPGIPDSMLIAGGPLVVGKSVPLSVSVLNDEVLSGIIVFLKMESVDGGFARLDSAVFVNRLADPTVLNFRFYVQNIDGVPVDSIALEFLNGGGENLPIGSSAIAFLYFTGLSRGQMSVRPWVAHTGDVSSVVLPLPGGSFRMCPVPVPSVAINVVTQPDFPFITLPQSVVREVAGLDLEIPVSYGSPQELPTTLTIESITGADDETLTPANMPVLIDDDSPRLDWVTTSSDVGIWRLALKATDSQNLSAYTDMEIQLVNNPAQLVEFGTTVSPIDLNTTGVAVGNFDSDPDFELFATSGGPESGPGAALYEISNFEFTRIFEQDNAIPKFGARLGYIDNDDNLDVVLTSWGTNVYLTRILQCYLGDGDNGYSPEHIRLDYGFARGATLGEFTGDNHIDYAMVTGDRLIVFPSNGDGAFASPTEISVPEVALSLNCADFNSDGRDDFALGTRQNIKIYLRRSVGDLSLAATYPQNYGAVDIDITNSGSDFNSDGKFDLCIATPSVGGSRSEMLVYFGNGDGTFESTEIRDINGQILASSVADFNGDTKLDIAFVNGASRYVGIIFGDGLGNFDSELRYPIPTLRPRLIECVDYDLDGDLDLVVAASGSAGENSFFLLTNQSDPSGYSAGQFEVNAQDNAQFTITAPGGGQLSELCNSIPASSMYKRDLNGNEMLDSYASLGVVENGEYIIRVVPKPNLPAESPFSLEYSYGDQNFRLAKNCPMAASGYEFGVPLDAGSVLPRPGSFVGATVGSFKWKGSGQFDFQLATDIGFQQIVTSQVVTGNILLYESDLGYGDTTTYFWRVKPAGTTEHGKIYSFNVIGAATAAENESPVLPLTYSLAQNYPNPFNPTTSIEFTMARSGQASVRVTNILGETVATLLDEIVAAGNHVVAWRGVDQSGRAIPSGVYFYSLKAGDYSNVRKMVLLK